MCLLLSVESEPDICFEKNYIYVKLALHKRRECNVINRLEETRKEKGITQEELANALEVSRQTVGSLENGRYNPSIILSFKIARFFDLSIEEVFIYEEDKNEKNKIWYLGYIIGICSLILVFALKLNEAVEIALTFVFAICVSLSHVKIVHHKMMEKDHNYKISVAYSEMKK